MTFDHPKEYSEPYGWYYSGYSTPFYGINPSPMSSENPKQTFFWFYHNGCECDPGDVHEDDHGRTETFEAAVRAAEAFHADFRSGRI